MIDPPSAPSIDFDFEIVIKLQLLTISMYFSVLLQFWPSGFANWDPDPVGN